MSTVTLEFCPICQLNRVYIVVSDLGERLSIKCQRCGSFTITTTAAAMTEKRELDPKLSAWIRERFESGANVPEIDSNTLKEMEAALPNYRVSEKQLLLLRAIERRTKFPGQNIVVIDNFDYPLTWASGIYEFRYLLDALIERGFVQKASEPDYRDGHLGDKIQITAAGWTFLEEHARPAVISDQVFVAMSFAPELRSAWESGIRPALVKAQFRPYRVDAVPNIDRIDMRIITEIKNSKFLVADVTQQRPGVYFEAGYAQGLGLPVFWCVRSDDLKNVHFDTRQYNHIVWEHEQQLADQLYFYVSAIIGKGSAT